MIKLLHTSDWHLGHNLYGISRAYEHQAFLHWLLEQLQQYDIDVLIIAGDIFDTANPSASAQSMFYQFLVSARKHQPRLQIIVIGGNHDSAGRLDAIASLCGALNIHVIGGLQRNAANYFDWQSLSIPLSNKEEEVEAWCGAMPFIRPMDLVISEDSSAGYGADADPLVDAVALHYQSLYQAIGTHRLRGQALVMTGHCYMVGSELSELSERKILGGNQHALPVEIFSKDIDYVALGHLHKAQSVGGQSHIRYSGSPIPLSLSEANYQHQVVILALDRGQLSDVQSLLVPRKVAILSIPEQGYAKLDDVLVLLENLALSDSLPNQEKPFLQVKVFLDEPMPTLRYTIEQAVAEKPVRLLKISTRLSGHSQSLADQLTHKGLDELKPDEVFVQCYKRHHDGEPSQELMTLFHQIVEQVEQEL